MSSYEHAMVKLSRSGNLASETFYRVVANMAVRSAIDSAQVETNKDKPLHDTNNASKFCTTPQITGDILPQCAVQHRNSAQMQEVPDFKINSPKKPDVTKRPKASSHKGIHSPPDVQLDISALEAVRDKIAEEREKRFEVCGVTAVEVVQDKISEETEEQSEGSCFQNRISEETEKQSEVSCISAMEIVQNKVAEEIEKQSEVSDYASTGHGTNAVYSDVKSSSHSRKDPSMSQRPVQCGRLLTSMDHSMRIMRYHMGRISFQCECHFEDIPLSAMSKADRRHCRRFHRGLLGRKKAEEKRNPNMSTDSP